MALAAVFRTLTTPIERFEVQCRYFEAAAAAEGGVVFVCPWVKEGHKREKARTALTVFLFFSRSFFRTAKDLSKLMRWISAVSGRTTTKQKDARVKPTCGAPKLIPPAYIWATRLAQPTF